MRALLLFAMVGVLASVGTASAASGDAFRPVGITAADTAVEAATALVEQRPALVDGADPDELVPAAQVRGAGGTTIVRFDQELHGVPVLGGEVVVTVDARRRVLAADGEIYDGTSPAFGPTVSAGQAQRLARAALGKGLGEELRVGDASLVIYDTRIIGGPGPVEPVLAWDFEVTNGADLRRRVFVDATTGYIVQTMDLIRTAKVRHVCDAGGLRVSVTYDGRVPCTAAFYARSEGGAESAVPDVNSAYNFAGVTYDFYAALGRDSMNGSGMPIVSTVRYCPPAGSGACPYDNAFWNGSQMVYGASYAAADDVVAHELTHGVTDYTSKLVYWYQSGAINEAMSDIMGELVDLANPGSGATEDTTANRWQIGEDLPLTSGCLVSGRRIIRDMQDPTVCGDPDKMTSVHYATGTGDYGGVHTNSGVANKTAYLIADGGTFNGQTVTALGLTKSAWLWYQTGLTLRFSSDFGDLADALDSSCSVLATLGTAGFTGADCTQVANAALATELRTEPANATVPAYCASGTPVDVFNDGFDAGPAANWTIGRTQGTANLWYGSSQASPDGANMHWNSALSTNARGAASQVRSDSTMAMSNSVVIPPGDSYLYFNHWYEFEYGFDDVSQTWQNYDAGVVEYSIGSSDTWVSIGALPTVNGYTGTVNASGNSDNALQGQLAYVAGSNGSVATRVELTSLAGQTVKFRFRVSTDTGTGTSGWYLDSTRIYGCSAGAPAITAVTPARGALAGGTTITLTGANLSSATGVTVGGSAATGVTVVNSTTVTAVTPARATSLVDVKVVTPTGTATKSAAYTYAVAAPTISGVSPPSGTTAGGTAITITGADLTGTTDVTVGGTPATSVTVVNSTTVTAVTPVHAAGAVAVAVATPGGATSAAGAFTYVAPPPTITGVSPSSGSAAGGTTITITGAHFTGAYSVMVGGWYATAVTVVSDTQVTAVTAARAAGTVDVSITTPNGTATSAGAFTYVAVPTITGVSPSSGSTAGGTTITITGVALTGASGVLVGGVAATSVTVVNSTTVTAVTPARAAGTVDVSITTPGGTATSAGAFTYAVPPPIITGVSPSSGSTAGGTTITITGAHLTGAYSVMVGGWYATGVTVVSATQVTAVTPAHAAGSADVAVTTPGGTATSAGAFTYVTPTPVITGVSPSSGATAGGTTITISGAGLTAASGVTVGGVAATSVTVVNATTVTAATPARAAGTVDVAITTPGGTATSAGAFTYVGAPAVTGVSPTSGSTAGGTTITITGAGLTGTSSVTVGGAAATAVTVVSAAQVTAVVPAHAAGTVDIALTTPGGTVVTIDAFTYTAPPPAPVVPNATSPVVAAVTPATPAATTSQTPPATGLWTANTTADVVRALFTYKSGTTYAIKAVKGSTTRKGTCQRAGATISCSVKAPNGRWKITVTPKVNGKTGKAISRTIST